MTNEQAKGEGKEQHEDAQHHACEGIHLRSSLPCVWVMRKSHQVSCICILKYTGVRTKAHLQNTLFCSHEQHRKWSAYLVQTHYATHTVRFFPIRWRTIIACSEDARLSPNGYTANSDELFFRG